MARSGVIGRWRQATGGGLNIVVAAMTFLSRISSTQVGTRRVALSMAFRHNINVATHLLATDAAADEVLASKILRTAGLSGKIKASFSLVKMVLRDKCHGSTRLLRRPFKADAEIDKVLHDMIPGKNSPAQLVQNSLEMLSSRRTLIQVTDLMLQHVHSPA